MNLLFFFFLIPVSAICVIPLRLRDGI